MLRIRQWSEQRRSYLNNIIKCWCLLHHLGGPQKIAWAVQRNIFCGYSRSLTLTFLVERIHHKCEQELYRQRNNYILRDSILLLERFHIFYRETRSSVKFIIRNNVRLLLLLFTYLFIILHSLIPISFRQQFQCSRFSSISDTFCSVWYFDYKISLLRLKPN